MWHTKRHWGNKNATGLGKGNAHFILNCSNKTNLVCNTLLQSQKQDTPFGKPTKTYGSCIITIKNES